MSVLDFRTATRIADAVAWLREDPDAKLLAGGQTLLAAMRLRLAAPTLLIDLQALPELKGLREDAGQLTVFSEQVLARELLGWNAVDARHWMGSQRTEA